MKCTSTSVLKSGWNASYNFKYSVAVPSQVFQAHRSVHSWRPRLLYSAQKHSSTLPLYNANGRRSMYTQYIKTSSQELPKWPLPSVEQTIKNFLEYVKIIETEENYEIARKLAKDFTQPGGTAEQVQALLQDIEAKEDNWTTEVWAKANYLENRWPLPPDSPATTFPIQNYSTLDQQIRYAAKVILGAMDYKARLDRGEISGETKAGPQEMYQFYLFFGTFRMPGEKMDDLLLGSQYDPQPKHIAVARKGHFFKVQVVDDNGQLLGENQIVKQLEKVCELAPERIRVEDSVALLSGADRTPWARVYQEMKKHPQNAACLEDIEKAQFVVSLDDEKVVSTVDPEDAWSAVCPQVLHGGGKDSSSVNRWFDKAIHFIIGSDGGCSLLWEHGPGEAPFPVDCTDHVLKFISKYEGSADASGKFEPVKRLDFEVPESARSPILVAGKLLDDMHANLDFCCINFKEMGKDVPKSFSVSPDSFLQVAFQIAYYRIHHMTENTTYESGALRKFRLGRTDTVRHPTPESKELLTLFDRPIEDSEKAILIRKAIDAHQRNLKRAINGQSFDRHLFVMREMAWRNGIKVHPLFESRAFEALTDFKLTTSQVANKEDCLTMYGPGGPRSYGVCYNPRKTNTNIMVASRRTLPNFSAKEFGEALKNALRDLKRVLGSVVPGG